MLGSWLVGCVMVDLWLWPVMVGQQGLVGHVQCPVVPRILTPGEEKEQKLLEDKAKADEVFPRDKRCQFPQP